MPTPWKNKLYFGDNLEIMRHHVADESVDLIYLDPPFNSQASYNMLFKETNGRQAAAQVQAFEDFWHWKDAAPTYFEVLRDGPDNVRQLLGAFHDFLGHNDMMAYLAMMAIRLVELRRVLKATGSIYLHCDPTASHYLRLVMDAVFGGDKFVNEIVWKRTNVHSHAAQGTRHFSRVQDYLLLYVKGSDRAWHQPYAAYTEEYVDKSYRLVEEDTGRRYSLGDLTVTDGGPKGNPRFEFLGVTRYWRYNKMKMEELLAQGRIVQAQPGVVPRQKRYLDEGPGVEITSVWTDIPPISAQAAERLGYPTQKPEALLERIILASSNEGDLVLDPFCGCGTTVAVAERLHRRWIGIDITHLAIGLMKHRVHSAFGPDLSDYEVIGEPEDLASARALFLEDRYQFQFWALSLVEARPATDQRKKGADKGIDGWQFFIDDQSGSPKRIVISVKGGGVGVSQVRDLRGVVEREQAEIGLFITLERPTGPMLREAAAAGMYQPPGLQAPVPKVQILTIEELVDGRTLELPPTANATFKRAPRRHKAKPQGPTAA